MELSCGRPAAALPGMEAESPGEDYESLPTGASLSTHMTAGAVAGILEHTVMYPVDSVKTRMQSLQPDPKAQYKSVYQALKKIIHTEGFWRPLRGINVTMLGAGPAHAMYFACYEKMKRTLSDIIHHGGNSHLANGIAGSMATLLHDAVMNPAEVVKQRMQMYNSPYKTVLECIRTVHRTEGLGAFYRSYTTQLTMNVPFQAIHFITYEFMQEQINPRREYNPRSHILSGAIAGAVAAAATTPLDVCKTLLNTQENMALSSVNISGHLSGMANAFRTVYQLGGIPGYFRGVQARVIYQMPSTAIAWSVYEFFKYFLTKHKLEKRAPY
ncbi:mitoferrin-1 isoform X1 [Trachemys scripta elegans]|uniref:mitoferrin-1 isoform X1 n=1 Tax=Trachemys scripta elegans TaxID=31138 RepID=UPI001552E491|nr:mitoferrin-1 isoform X1 [Trachemys scripta elegans]XP_053874401.1 mitoferrin-1 isoform X3 [Malaclemys terrapin pileata]